MNESFCIKLQKTHTLICLFLGMLVYKFAVDLSYFYRSIVLIDPTYPLLFNPLKYILGLFWCMLLFTAIHHTKKKVSSALLYLTFLFQIIPITTIYALKDDNSVYYNVLCLSFLMCELIVSHIEERPVFRRNFTISRTMTLFYTVAIMILIIYIIVKNGAPHLSLLNINTVYEYRSSGTFQINKYMGYMLSWTVFVFLPFAIVKGLTDGRYQFVVFVMGALLLIYLYTGLKSYLFAGPLILICSMWSKRKNFYQELFLLGCVGFSILTLLAYFSEPGSIWYYILSLFGRRLLLLSANNKFLYYDYFLTHPKEGIAGVFPRWIINIPTHYPDVHYSHDISDVYYGVPEMQSNTGFFAEGYLRFGHIGTIMLLLLFALLLKQMDWLQDRTGYSFVFGLFVYPILVLSDGHLLDSLVFGPWMYLAAVLLFYKPSPDRLPGTRNQVVSTGLSIPRIKLCERKRGAVCENFVCKK